MPETYVIEIGNICNLRCRFCPTGNRAPIDRGMMSLEDFKRVFQKIRLYARTFHLYNFGEPFLNKDLVAIISLSARAGVETHIDSNLTARELTDREAEAIVTSGLNRLVASIDGASQETYELYRIGGSFERAMENLKRLARAKARLSARTPDLVWKLLLHAFNEHEMEKARQMARKIGVRILFDLMDVPEASYESSFHRRRRAGEQLDLQTAVGCQVPELPAPGGPQGSQENPAVPPTQPSPITECPQPQQLAVPPPQHAQHKLPLPITEIRLAPQLYSWCLQPFHTAVINFDGDLYPCCNVFGPAYATGNLHRQSLEEIWNGSKMRACRQFLLGYGPQANTGSICETLPCPVASKHL